MGRNNVTASVSICKWIFSMLDVLTFSQTTDFRLPNWKSFQATISYLLKMSDSSLNWLKTLRKKEKFHYEQFLLFPQCFQKICTVDI